MMMVSLPCRTRKVVDCVFREISDTQTAMKSVEDSKSQLLIATNELQTKLEASNSDSVNFYFTYSIVQITG